VRVSTQAPRPPAGTIGLYPGALSKVQCTAAQVRAKFGRLVAPDSTPIAGASITGQGVGSEIDEDEYF
jgi:hypothetical protein